MGILEENSVNLLGLFIDLKLTFDKQMLRADNSQIGLTDLAETFTNILRLVDITSKGNSHVNRDVF